GARPARRSRPAWWRPSRSPAQQLRLEREHLALVRLVVHAGEVQRAVDDGLAQVLGVIGAYDDVAQFARARGRARFVDRKGQHVGRTARSAVGLVELGDALGPDELDGDMAVLDARRREREADETLDLGPRRRGRPAVADDLDL